MTYIEREALGIGKCNPAVFVDEGYARGWNAAIEIIQKAPAADVQPVVRGKWVPDKEDVYWGASTVRYHCSHCGRLPHFDKESYKFLLSEFCPKCGAKMEGS